MLTTTMSERIHRVSFRFKQDPIKEPFCLNAEPRARHSEQEVDRMPAIGPTDCPDTVHNSSPRNRRNRRNSALGT